MPYQNFTDDFSVGVVAFATHGIDRIEFSVNGGAWLSVREMVLNPRTNVVEYWVNLNPDTLPDGAVEVRAVAYPKQGTPRVLDTLKLHNNVTPDVVRLQSGETLGDVTSRLSATLTRPLIIELPAGDHGSAGGRYWGGDYWVTVRPAPGVNYGDVRIVAGGRGKGIKIHYQGVALDVTAPDNSTPLSIHTGALWIDQSTIQGDASARLTGVGWSPGQAWATDVKSYDLQKPYRFIKMVRNIEDYRGIDDTFAGVSVILNATVHELGIRGGHGANALHPDVSQLDSPWNENVIFYNLTATDKIWAQGLGFAGLKEAALVNVRVDNTGVEPFTALQNFQMAGTHEGVLIQDSYFKGRNSFRVDRGYTAKDVVVVNTTFVNQDGRIASSLPAPLTVKFPGAAGD